MYIGTGTCILIVIAFVLIAGCAFLNPGNTPAQSATQGSTPTLTVVPTATLEATPAAPGETPVPTATLEAAQTTQAGETAVPTATLVGAAQTTGAVVSVIPTQQTAVASVADTCADTGGHICLADETCSGDLISTTDSSKCCAGTCLIPSYATTPAQNAVTPTLVAGGTVVISNTCAGIGGTICQTNQTCNGAIVTTTDSSQCCAAICV